jgi:hypothetical protein
MLPRCSIKLTMLERKVTRIVEKEEEERRRHAVAEIATSIVCVQKMNNDSASLIVNGRYEKAIRKLGKALEVLQSVDDITMNHYHSSTCTCWDCSLKGCIEYSSTNKVEGFHRKPIFIPKHVIRENHCMGTRLFLILTFNLALAHHLNMLNQKSKNKKS